MIQLTPKAEQRIKQMLSKRGKGLGIRLGVKTTGCSGLAYTLEYVDNPADEDVEYTYTGFRAFVDPKSLVYLDGMLVDYVREGLNEGFKFNNPNSKGECGCGESFRV
jgi:iron-sulfur cluster assembly protein